MRRKYLYRCDVCELTFEHESTVESYTKTTACPNCSQESRRQFTPPAVQFKGPGFYSTDKRD